MLTCKKKEYAWNGEEKNKKKIGERGRNTDAGQGVCEATMAMMPKVLLQDTTAVLPYPDLPRQKGDVTCMPAGSLKREEGDRRGGEKSFRQCGCEFGGRAIQ